MSEFDPTLSVPGPALLSAPAVAGRFVNARCIIHEHNGIRIAVADGSPIYSWVSGDQTGENVFVVQARELELATIDELAVALNRPERTLFLAWQQYRAGGVAALVPKRRGRPKGSRDVLRDAEIRRLRQDGQSLRKIAEHLGTTPLTVVRALARMGLGGQRTSQVPLLAEPAAAPDLMETADAGQEEATVEPIDAEDSLLPSLGALGVEGEAPRTPASADADPHHRTLDRFLASQGAIDDAAPLFADGVDLPNAGALLAIPGLVASDALPTAARLYGDIGPAFYGLRTSIVAIVLLSLLRVKRPEHLKEHSPVDLGRVLGLDRVPEVKTLRRKLHRLAAGPSEQFLLELTRTRLKSQADAVGWLYVDGHVRVYNGKYRLPMAHVTRLRISMPATQDMWIHDGDGRPILVVTQEAHPSLAAALPPMLEAAREVVGDQRVTIVFDRGGWSPSLFARLGKDGADILTYRKGESEPVPADWFTPHPGRTPNDTWLLHDASVRLPNGLWLRQITRRVGEHQTAIVTTRQDLPAEVLARRMFDRWRQENFFKYMRQEFDLDGLYEHGAEEDDPLREAPNPDWTRADKLLGKSRAAQRALLAEHVDRAHPDVVAASTRVTELKLQRDALPRRVQVQEMADPTLRLPARVKNLYDGLKTLAWQIETDLVNAVTPFYKRSADEGRTFVGAALRSRGSLTVGTHDLTVTLAPQSSPHRTRALAELCRLLDATNTQFPGTSLRLRYRVADHQGDSGDH